MCRKVDLIWYRRGKFFRGLISSRHRRQRHFAQIQQVQLWLSGDKILSIVLRPRRAILFIINPKILILQLSVKKGKEKPFFLIG